jgi:hypothetical protein
MCNGFNLEIYIILTIIIIEVGLGTSTLKFLLDYSSKLEYGMFPILLGEEKRTSCWPSKFLFLLKTEQLSKITHSSSQAKNWHSNQRNAQH